MLEDTILLSITFVMLFNLLYNLKIFIESILIYYKYLYSIIIIIIIIIIIFFLYYIIYKIYI